MEKEFKTVYTADKGSYGIEFRGVYDTLDELKRAIVMHQLNMFGAEDENYQADMYSEELFQYCTEGIYDMYKVKLHKSEKIEFQEYDGTSSPYIVKIEPNYLSTMDFIPKED